MDIDRHRGIGLLVFIVIAIVALLVWMTGFGATRELITTGQGTIGSYTSNESAYQGFSQSFTAAPLLIGLLFVGMIVFAGWQFVKRIVKGNEER